MTADAKKLEEEEETGTRKYRYIKTGENHFGFAFCYAWLAGAKMAWYYWQYISFGLDD